MNRILLVTVIVCSALGACTTHKNTVVERAAPATTVVVPDTSRDTTIVVPPQ